MTPADTIADKGVGKIAEAINIHANTVAVWKIRNRIPRDHWPELSKAFPDLTTERLLEIEKAGESPKKAKRAAKAA